METHCRDREAMRSWRQPGHTHLHTVQAHASCASPQGGSSLATATDPRAAPRRTCGEGQVGGQEGGGALGPAGHQPLDEHQEPLGSTLTFFHSQLPAWSVSFCQREIEEGSSRDSPSWAPGQEPLKGITRWGGGFRMKHTIIHPGPSQSCPQSSTGRGLAQRKTCPMCHHPKAQTSSSGSSKVEHCHSPLLSPCFSAACGGLFASCLSL